MKSLYLTILFVTIFGCSYAQWTTNGNNISNTNLGNVGIGTTSPSANLSIFDPTGSMPGGISAPAKSILNLTRFGTPGYSYNEGAEFRLGHGGPSGWGSKVDFYINGASNQSGIPDQHVMTWLYNGYVGIGTTAPQANLELKANLSFDGTTMLRISNNSSDYGRTTLVLTGRIQDGNDLWNFGSGARNAIVFSENAATTGLNVGAIGDEKFSMQLEGNSNSLGFLSKQNGNAPNMILTQSGNVLIGKTSQNNTGYKLDIAGSVRANAVTVNTNGADFVFEPIYKLSSLSDLKKYIDQNHHLPEIASAKEMQANGLNLGENQTKLLQKVEELTLYLIEKEKEKQEQLEINSQLQKKLSDQQSQIDLLGNQLDQLKKQVQSIINK